MNANANVKGIAPKKMVEFPPYLDIAGKRQYNQYAIETTPWIQTIDESGGTSAITISANSTVQYQMSNSGLNGVVDLRKLLAKATSVEYQVGIYDTYRNMELSNRNIHSKCLFGGAGRAYDLAYPIILAPSTSLILSLTDLSGASNTLYLYAFGQKYLFESPRKIIDSLSPLNSEVIPYFYTTDAALELPAATTEQYAYISILSNHDFFCHEILSHSEGDYLFKITDVGFGGDNGWQNGWIHSGVLGNSEYHFKENPFLIRKNSKLKISVSNLSGATNKVYMTLAGVSRVEK